MSKSEELDVLLTHSQLQLKAYTAEERALRRESVAALERYLWANRELIARALRLHESYEELERCGSENAYAEGWNDCLSVLHEFVK